MVHTVIWIVIKAFRVTLKKIPLVDLDFEESGQSRALRQLHATDAMIPNGAAK